MTSRFLSMPTLIDLPCDGRLGAEHSPTEPFVQGYTRPYPVA